MESLVFGIAILVCWLIGGVTLLLIAASWNPRPDKSLFIAFVISLFLALPFLELIIFAMAFWLDRFGNSYQAIETLLMLNGFLISFLLFLSEALLIAYAISRRTSDRSRLLGDRGLESDPTWDVEASPHQLVSILRKREWAFLIDQLPVIGLFCVMILLSNFAVDSFSYRRRGMEEIIVPLFFLGEIIAFVYLVLKDMVGGQSVGKRISGCRVVDQLSGLPIGFSQSLMRNLIFLIPPLALVELAAASFRSDRRRFGDLLAGTVVVQGGPKGIAHTNESVEPRKAKAEVQQPPAKHPLDD